jgi:hypothetical protein
VLQRGEVRVGDISFPGRGTARKLLIVLQGGSLFASEADVVVVVASSWRDRPPRPFEVVLLAATSNFHNDTVIDCRWPFTVRRADVEAMRLLFVLGADVMELIDEALLVGLQMTGPPPLPGLQRGP